MHVLTPDGCNNWGALQEHKEKVRAVKYDPVAKYAATLSSDATVNIWDPRTMHVVDTVNLMHDKELVSMAVQVTKPNSPIHPCMGGQGIYRVDREFSS